jgi:hypothetical protein
MLRCFSDVWLVAIRMCTVNFVYQIGFFCYLIFLLLQSQKLLPNVFAPQHLNWLMTRHLVHRLVGCTKTDRYCCSIHPLSDPFPVPATNPWTAGHLPWLMLVPAQWQVPRSRPRHSSQIVKCFFQRSSVGQSNWILLGVAFVIFSHRLPKFLGSSFGLYSHSTSSLNPVRRIICSQIASVRVMVCFFQTFFFFSFFHSIKYVFYVCLIL